MDVKTDRKRANLICRIALFGGPALGGIAYANEWGLGMMFIVALEAMFMAFVVTGLSASVSSSLGDKYRSYTVAAFGWIALFGVALCPSLPAAGGGKRQ